MTKRDRLEDLGRLQVHLRTIFDDEIFERKQVRNKDFCDHFYMLDREKQEDILTDFVYGLDRIQDQISYCLCIAEGTDELNEQST